MKIITGIASSTHLDLHGERMSKNALESMAHQINAKYLPLNLNHDDKMQIGIILHGKVVLYDSGEFALMVVIGIFEKDEERQIFKKGKKNNTGKNFKSYLDNFNILEDKSTNLNQRRELDVDDLLEIHLDSTKINSQGEIVKIKKFVASVGDLRIEVYPKDHLPSHFHVISKQRGINARFNLKTLDLLSMKKGEIRQKDLRKIQHFFKAYPKQLEKLRKEHKKLSG